MPTDVVAWRVYAPFLPGWLSIQCFQPVGDTGKSLIEPNNDVLNGTTGKPQQSERFGARAPLNETEFAVAAEALKLSDKPGIRRWDRAPALGPAIEQVMIEPGWEPATLHCFRDIAVALKIPCFIEYEVGARVLLLVDSHRIAPAVSRTHQDNEQRSIPHRIQAPVIYYR
jgi:hypothetical protein